MRFWKPGGGPSGSKLRRALGRLSLILLLTCTGVVAGSMTTKQPADAGMVDVPGAVTAGVNNAASVGVTQYIVVLDRGNGQTVASTANANAPVASESIMKLFIAAYYLRAYNGNLPAQLSNELWHMIVYSDDSTASQYWKADIIPTISAAYGMPNTSNDPSRPGYWGAARITAADMATFLWRADNDPAVKAWLYGAMVTTADYGSDGYNQNFGLNSIAGAASKQGWGCDSYWAGPCAIHSVGGTNEVLAVVLQTGSQGTYGSQQSTATYTAQQVVAAARKPTTPIGTIDSVSVSSQVVTLTGWALDPDTAYLSPAVAVYRNGVGLVSQWTASYRADVNAAYGATANLGFSISLSGQPDGTHTYCMYAIDFQNMGNPSIGCRTVTIGAAAAPTSTFDAAQKIGARGAILRGWTFDRDSVSESLWVAVYRNNVPLGWYLADQPRADVNSAFGIAGDHGFAIDVGTQPPGPQQYCLYVMDPQGVHNHVFIGCRSLSFTGTQPIGVVDTVVAQSGGTVAVTGWTFDRDAQTHAIAFAVYRDGQGLISQYTAVNRADVNSVYGITGTHGFSATLSGQPSGQHTYCVFGLDDSGLAANPLLGCKSIVVT